MEKITKYVCPDLVVRVKSPYQDEIELKGTDIKLFIETDYNRRGHATIKGEVVSVPKVLRDKVIDGRGYDNKWYKECDIDLSEIKVGDTIYFHPAVTSGIDNKDKIWENPNLIGREEDGSYLYRLQPMNVFGVVKEDGVVAIGSRIFVEPVVAENQTESGLYLNWNNQAKKYKQGKVKWVGKDFYGNQMEVRPGDMVIFYEKSDWEMEIEGERLYVMYYYRDVVAIITEENTKIGSWQRKKEKGVEYIPQEPEPEVVKGTLFHPLNNN